MKNKIDSSKAWDRILDFASTSEWKEILWLWYSTTVTGTYLKESTRRERTEIKMAFELFHALMEEIEQKKNK
ncbi:MAG: hypothetical protein ACRCSM_08295 [Sediminibacterium sp.]|jgi:hypothetical protein|nr:hypothetical protein [Chitinophagaceae bacterium]MCA6446083.1 hypothetical protein [Chitinophagaceae bacterium]